MLRGEVWWVAFDPAIGSEMIGREIQKTRPAVTVSNDASNRHLARVQVIPLTSCTGRLYPSEALVVVDGQESKAMTDQIMTADKRRLKSLLGKLSREDMKSVEQALKTQLGLPQ